VSIFSLSCLRFRFFSSSSFRVFFSFFFLSLSLSGCFFSILLFLLFLILIFIVMPLRFLFRLSGFIPGRLFTFPRSTVGVSLLRNYASHSSCCSCLLFNFWFLVCSIAFKLRVYSSSMLSVTPAVLTNVKNVASFCLCRQVDTM